VKIPLTLDRSALDISVEVESALSEGSEPLTVEFLDMVEGRWRSLSSNDHYSTREEWRRLKSSGPIEIALPEQAKETIAQISKDALPDVEILEVYIEAENQRSVILKEREPFDVCIRVLFRQSPQVADVAIKFSRADGVYVFWQSSGLVNANLHSPIGEKLVKFRFQPNDLGAGEYYINAHVSNGWNFPDNYPYGQVFVRAVNAAVFRILPEMPELDFGVLNARVNVDIVDVK
jgi:lipopolysaccharide transport system ATP-binding protein